MQRAHSTKMLESVINYCTSLRVIAHYPLTFFFFFPPHLADLAGLWRETSCRANSRLASRNAVPLVNYSQLFATLPRHDTVSYCRTSAETPRAKFSKQSITAWLSYMCAFSKANDRVEIVRDEGNRDERNMSETLPDLYIRPRNEREREREISENGARMRQGRERGRKSGRARSVQ